MFLRESVCVSLNIQRIRNTLFEVSCFRPVDVIVLRHEDDPIFEFLKVDSLFCHLSLNLKEQFAVSNVDVRESFPDKAQNQKRTSTFAFDSSIRSVIQQSRSHP